MTRSTPSLARLVCAVAAVALTGSVTACAPSEPGSAPGSPSEPGAPSGAGTASDDFCGGVEGIGEDLALLQMSEIQDPAGFPEQISRAADRFTGLEPPAEIAEPWQGLADLLADMDEALKGVTVTGTEDVQRALQSRMKGPDALARLLALPGWSEEIGVHVQDACHVDLGITAPALADVCAVVDTAHLGSVFAGTVPQGENRRWGNGTVECMWDDGDDREVGIVVMPADAMRADILKDAAAQRTVRTEGAPIEVYNGAFGPLRAGPGSTAVTIVGGTGVLASVAIEDTEAAALKAVALAGLVATSLDGAP